MDPTAGDIYGLLGWGWDTCVSIVIYSRLDCFETMFTISYMPGHYPSMCLISVRPPVAGWMFGNCYP